MEISLANMSVVNNRGNHEIPPPMVVVSPGVMSMQYKWSVASHPEVTWLANNGMAAAKRSQIEHLRGYKLKIVIR